MSLELRDRFFALSAGPAEPEEIARFKAEVDAVDPEPAAVLDGLAVCWHPTARFKAVRFVDAEDLDPDVRELFARPCEAAPYLAAVFADPRELSFRNFENIVPLDDVFAGVPLELKLAGCAELAKDAFSFSVRLPDAARAALDRLDGLGLYVPPLNAASRGGERFIFHSALLAAALGEAVAGALPLEGFSHVNPVFRCNRFEPGDANFHRHLDTPYYDAARQQVSKYTVLLYLTGGSAPAVLDLAGEVALASVEAFTCVVFDQRYAHEGAPYLAGRKVFLRTELIFTDPGVSRDPEIGALFSKACYLTGESVFAPELAAYADAYYSRVAAAHWNGRAVSAVAREPFVHKEFRGVHFVANGYDFWFGKGLSLAECAAITLLDYFNCKVGTDPFRALCQTETIEADDTAWIPAFLAARRSQPVIAPFDKDAFFPDPERSGSGHCCPYHWPRYDPRRGKEIIELYTRAQDFTKKHVMPAPILMLGEDVVLDSAKFVIQGNLIHVLGDKALAPVNFAACWSYSSPDNYIDVAATVGVAHFLVPPILFSESEDDVHLRFDFFRNSWTAGHKQAAVPIPMIRDFPADGSGMPDEDMSDEEWEECETTPWLDAVDDGLVSASGRVIEGIWWDHGRPLVSELYADLASKSEAGS